MAAVSTSNRKSFVTGSENVMDIPPAIAAIQEVLLKTGQSPNVLQKIVDRITDRNLTCQFIDYENLSPPLNQNELGQIALIGLLKRLERVLPEGELKTVTWDHLSFTERQFRSPTVHKMMENYDESHIRAYLDTHEIGPELSSPILKAMKILSL